MALIGFGSPGDLLRDGRYFDIRKEWERFDGSSKAGDGVTLAEFTEAFKSLQQEFARDGDVQRWLHGKHDRDQLLDKLAWARIVSTSRMSDWEIERKTRSAVGSGRLVLWPGGCGILRHLRVMKARSAAARYWSERSAVPAGAPAVQMSVERMTPTLLRKQMGLADPQVDACGRQNLSAKASRWRGRKQRITRAREQAEKMPVGPERERLIKAANRFELNNLAVEQARLSNHVYHLDDQEVPEGWVNVSGDPQALSRFGLKADLLTVESKTLAQVYKPDANVFGTDTPSQVAFQGSRLRGSDWENNAEQALDLPSDYYARAVRIGQYLTWSKVPVQLTGHSLGGGMASAASRTSGLPATIINAAGLHPFTVYRYSGAEPQAPSIHAFHVRGDPVTAVQSPSLNAFPPAPGIQHDLPGHGWSPRSRHSIEQAIEGFESQKREDQASIVEELQK